MWFLLTIMHEAGHILAYALYNYHFILLWDINIFAFPSLYTVTIAPLFTNQSVSVSFSAWFMPWGYIVNAIFLFSLFYKTHNSILVIFSINDLIHIFYDALLHGDTYYVITYLPYWFIISWFVVLLSIHLFIIYSIFHDKFILHVKQKRFYNP